jgi:hypothetical protein
MYSSKYNYQDKDGRKFYRSKRNPEIMWKNVTFRFERDLINRLDNLLADYMSKNGLIRGQAVDKFFSEFLEFKGY